MPARDALVPTCARPSRTTRYGQPKRDLAILKGSSSRSRRIPPGAPHTADRARVLDELLEYVSSKDADDPWGTPYEMLCSEQGFAVHSLGADRQRNTDDDVWSSRRSAASSS